MVSWLSDSQREDAYIDKGLGTSKCGRGWVGVRGNCKRAKRSRSKAALKRVKEGRARPEDAPHASVRLTVGEKAKALKMAQEVRKAKGMSVKAGWSSRLAALEDLGRKGPASPVQAYTAGQIPRSKISDESQALLLAKMGEKMPFGFENKSGVVFATKENGASFYDKTEWFEETRPQHRFSTQKAAIAYAVTNQSENERQREDIIIVPVKTGSGTRYIPFRRIMNLGQYQDYDMRGEHSKTVAESAKVSYRDMIHKTKVLQRMNEYDEMAWNIAQKATQGTDRFKRLENAAVEAMFWTGSRNFKALADHLEKDLVNPHGPHAPKGAHVERGLKATAKLLRTWHSQPERIPRRVQELIKGRIEVDGESDLQVELRRQNEVKKTQKIEAQKQAYDRELNKMFGDIKELENLHGELLHKMRFTRFVAQKMSKDQISAEDYAKFMKDGKLLAGKDLQAAEKIEKEINEIKERPFAV